jgi:hypothetical protein
VSTLAQTIRSGLGSNNEATKQKIEATLSDLEQNFARVGTLAGMAERYIRTHEELVAILLKTQRAQRLLEDDIDRFSDSANPRYAGDWRVMEAVFADIEASGRPIEEALNQRTEWFTQLDRDQIPPLLREFQFALSSTSQAVRYKASSDVRNGIQQMTRQLQTAETLVRNTLFDDILAGLETLGRRRD